jgi:microcystin-dependent protein
MPNLTTLIRWNSPSFPVGYCFTDFNRLFLDAAAFGSFTLNTDAGNSFFNFGDTLPDAANRIFPWLRTVGGYPDDWYIFVNGAWVSEYKRAPAESVGGFGLRHAYTGTEASLLTFDGGENAPVGPATGPFWEVDHVFDGRIPVGPGALPSTATVALGDVAGDDRSQLAGNNVPSHFHEVSLTESSGVPSTAALGGFGVGTGATGSSSSDLQWRASATSTLVGYTRPNTALSSITTPFTNMQPYVGAFWIKRTARIYKRVDS